MSELIAFLTMPVPIGFAVTMIIFNAIFIGLYFSSKRDNVRLINYLDRVLHLNHELFDFIRKGKRDE